MRYIHLLWSNLIDQNVATMVHFNLLHQAIIILLLDPTEVDHQDFPKTA